MLSDYRTKAGAVARRYRRVSWRVEDGRTIVRLKLEANQSVFVVFREHTAKTSEEVPVPQESLFTQLDGEWE